MTMHTKLTGEIAKLKVRHKTSPYFCVYSDFNNAAVFSVVYVYETE